jgi:hypothetical protein
MATKKAGGKRAATKRSSKKAGATGAGEDAEGFTSGTANENIRPETVGRRGVTGDLPGMEDRRIAELHNAALAYAEIRDRRMALNEEEGVLKDKLIALMKKHKKEEYNCEGVRIIFEHVEEDKLKVKVPKADDGGDSD